METILKCGCRITTKTSDEKPYCLIHDCDETITIDENILVKRQAKCAWCGRKVESNTKLPFFKHKPESDCDEYYCGCGGWN